MYTNEQNSSDFFQSYTHNKSLQIQRKKIKETKQKKKQNMSTVNRKNIRFSEKMYYVSFLTVSDNAH